MKFMDLQLEEKKCYWCAFVLLILVVDFFWETCSQVFSPRVYRLDQFSKYLLKLEQVQDGQVSARAVGR